MAILIPTLWATSGHAATSPDGLWRDLPRDRIAVKGRRQTIPDSYRTVALALPELDTLLRTAPAEKSRAGGIIISLPLPDGSFQEFTVEYSPIMAPELANRYPGIRTYLAVARDNAATTARLDLTPAGFHAIIFGTAGTVYIDPYQTGSTAEYISYHKRDFRSNREPFYCAFTGQKVGADHSILDHAQRVPGDPGTVAGAELRTYRLAVAATGEYTTFHGGTIALGLAAIVTTINRVTGIYERELAVRLSLVANNDSIVYTDALTDPYDNDDPFELLDQNQVNLDAEILSANYDIGHVFGTGGGGLAGLRVVCDSNRKAQGETGSATPAGDPFDVDFVAHEIGHQFGGNHSFNGTTFNCSGGNRNAATAYEPGSGTTIMAYAGICGAENIQSNSDDYFHTISIDEMVAYIAGGGNCASTTATANTIPIIDAGPGFTVPIGTPLLLRSDDAIDPDTAQVLTYGWEQFDLGAAAPPNTDDGNRPIFRSFTPRVSTVRFLPQMTDILANTSTLGESLPTTSRALTFRLTARDNAPGGGGVAHDTVVHLTTDTSGPFLVTSQNTATNWTPGSTQTVSWDVANTTAPPVNCADVDILYSELEFVNFSGTSLLAGTPNDGSESITVPLTTTTAGRIMVKCSSNIFFDVNNAPIMVTSLCGNSMLDAGEQCDDGNAGGGDGCSTFCQVEPGWSCSLPAPPSQPSNCELDGNIIVDKFTVPPGSPDLFPFNTNFSSSFNLADVTTPFNSGDLTATSLSATYSVTEDVLPGWDLTDITCVGNSPKDPGAIILEPFETVICSFTNTQRGTIIVDKVTDPPGSAQQFEFALTGTGVDQAFGLTDAMTPHESVNLLPTAANGTYNVAESLPAGWNLSSASCDDGSPVGAVDLVPGETVTCTFNNTIERGSIIVDKVTEPPGSDQSFEFTTSWGDPFNLTDASSPFDSGPLLPTSEAGVYSVTETIPDGWILESATCDDGSPPDAIDIDPGEVVICTFTNTLNEIFSNGFE